MAKKKTKATPVTVAYTDPLSKRSLRADALLETVVKDVEKKMSRVGTLIGNDSLIHVLPVPALAVRYLLQNEGWPLSCVYQVVGPEASYKSTFTIEVLRWHRMCGGFGQLNEAETKQTPDLRMSVLNWDENACHVENCACLEDWQQKTWWTTEALIKRMEQADGPGRTVPICLIVDSLTGKASRHTIKKIAETGHASREFALEAMLISKWMKAYPQKLLGWPFTFIGVNHLKAAIDQMTGMVDRTIPGGWALKFQQAMEIEMAKLGMIKEFATYKAVDLALQTYKNSYGPDRVRIHVRFKTWMQEDAPGLLRLHSRFEWWEASVLLLAKGVGMRKSAQDRLLPKIKEICDFHEKAGGSAGKLWWSNRLGVPSADAMSAHELGVLLEQTTDVLSDLYGPLGITRRPFFRPGVDYLQQIETYAHVAQQADVADDLVRRAQELQKQACDLGAAAGVAPTDADEGV